MASKFAWVETAGVDTPVNMLDECDAERRCDLCRSCSLPLLLPVTTRLLASGVGCTCGLFSTRVSFELSEKLKSSSKPYAKFDDEAGFDGGGGGKSVVDATGDENAPDDDEFDVCI